MPELGLQGTQQLMAMSKEHEPSYNATISVVVFRSMDEEVATVDNFYNRETRKTSVASVLLVVVAALIVHRHILPLLQLPYQEGDNQTHRGAGTGDGGHGREP